MSKQKGARKGDDGKKRADLHEGDQMLRSLCSERFDSRGCLKMKHFYDLLPQGRLKKDMYKYMDLDVLFQRLKYNPAFNGGLQTIETTERLDSLSFTVPKLQFVYNSDKGTDEKLNVYRIIVLLMAVRQLLLRHKPAETVPAPAFVFTDVHGQFNDLLRWLAKIGGPEQQDTYNYVVCGDSVDRGPNQLEAMLLMLYYKLRFPSRFFFLRGNHEDPSLHNAYGFETECQTRLTEGATNDAERELGKSIYFMIVHVFNYLPTCLVLDQKIYCSHGGISPIFTKCETCVQPLLLDVCTESEHQVTSQQANHLLQLVNTRIKNPCECGKNITTIADMPRLRKMRHSEHANILLDITWSDPVKFSSKAKKSSNDRSWLDLETRWAFNTTRSTSFFFGVDAIQKFLHNYKLELIIRGHDVRDEGYEWHYKRKLLTVFTAPQYDGGNNGGIAMVSTDAGRDSGTRKLRVDPVTISHSSRR